MSSRLIAGLLVLSFVVSSPAAYSQGRKFAKKPLLRAWFNLDETAANDYFIELMKDYEVESSFMSGALAMGRKNANPRPELQGMLVLMAKGLVPGVAQLTFRTVKDEAEFRKMILAAKNQLGRAATMSGQGDHYVLELDFTQGIPIFGPEGEGTDEEGNQRMIQIPGREQWKDNPQVLASLKQTLHFRLVDNLMWQGDVPEIMEMDLPTLEQLQPSGSMDNYDILAEFNLEQVPDYVKSLAFGAVKVAANAGLQQRDDEEEITYKARRASGDIWLEILRTFVYDINKGKFSVRFARDGKPIRIRLNLEARKESQLAKVGKTLAGGGTRFAAVRNRTAPLTLATTWGMPDLARTWFRSQLALARRDLEGELAGNPDGLEAVGKLGDLLAATVDAGQTDMMFQLTGDVLTGFAVVGGIRVKEAEQARDGLDQLLSSIPEGGRLERSEDQKKRKYLSLPTGRVPIPGSEEDHFEGSVNFTSYDSCLWFSFGGPSALALLKDTVAFAEGNRRSASRGEAFQFAFDLSEWMEGDDDVDGFNQYPRQAMLTAERKIDQGVSQIFDQLRNRNNRGGAKEVTPFVPRASFISKALEQGGDEIDFRLNIGGSGIDLDIDIGRGVANMIMARMVDFQGKAMDALMQMQ